MDAIKAKYSNALRLAEASIKENAERYFDNVSADIPDDELDDLQSAIDMASFGLMWVCFVLFRQDEKARAAWDPTHPDHVWPQYGGAQ